MPIQGPTDFSTLDQNRAYYNKQGEVGSTQLRTGQPDFLFSSGFTVEEVELSIMWKYWDEQQNYLLHVFMRWFDARMFPVADEKFGWWEHGKTRIGLPVADLTAVGSTLITVVDSREKQYYRLKDQLVIGNNGGVSGIIVSIGGSSVAWEYTMRKMGGGIWNAGDIIVGDIMGYSSNSHGEGEGHGVGRKWSPEERTGFLSLVKEQCEHTGHAGATDSIFMDMPGGGQAWVDHNIFLTIKEFYKSRENALAMHDENTGADGNPVSTKGVVNCILDEAANPVLYLGSPDSQVLEDLIASFNSVNNAKEFLILAGQTAYNDLQTSIREDHLQGNATYTGTGNSVFGENLRLALGIDSYSIFGRTVHLSHYRQFDNPDEMGEIAGGPTAANIDYSNFFLVINLRTSSDITETRAAGRTGDTNVPLISYMYMKNGKGNRAFFYATLKGNTGMHNGYEFGQTSDGDAGGFKAYANPVATDLDVDRFLMASHVGVRMPMVDVSHTFGRAIG